MIEITKQELDKRLAGMRSYEMMEVAKAYYRNRKGFKSFTDISKKTGIDYDRVCRCKQALCTFHGFVFEYRGQCSRARTLRLVGLSEGKGKTVAEGKAGIPKVKAEQPVDTITPLLRSVFR